MTVFQKNSCSPIREKRVFVFAYSIAGYTKKGVTTINYLRFTKEFIKQALSQDDGFQQSLPESCHRMIKLIEAST